MGTDTERSEINRSADAMNERFPVVFLVDVVNTLLDNGHIQNDLREHLEREFGAACRDRYWKILDGLASLAGVAPDGRL
jgi:hypothetical protein